MMYLSPGPGSGRCKSRLVTAAVAALIAVCGGGNAGAAPLTAKPFAQQCSDLIGTSIPESAITLATRGALVSNAEVVAAAGSTGDFCKVNGAIRAVDRTAPPINFQVNLPAKWNGKAMHFGGGGMNGSLVTGLGNVPGTPAVGANAIPTPLARGYATFGSDSGHSGGVFDGTFALNNEAFSNFAGDQLRKTLDSAQFILKAFYGKLPAKQYFAGGSQGGHEAFTVIQRWPDKYSGIIAYYPVLNYTGAILSELRQQKAIFGAPGAWFNPAKAALIRSATLAACDALDGVADGLISNGPACATTFDVKTLRCAGGADTGDTCLSDAQLAAVGVMNSPSAFNFSLNTGINSFPAWPILQGADPSPLVGTTSQLSSSVLGRAVGSFVRFFVAKDSTVDLLAHNPDQFALQYVSVANALDSLTTDLSLFKNRGGKIIWVHGTVDYLYPPNASIEYYQRLITAYGQAGVQSFARFYLVPGYAHGAAAPGGMNLSFDSVPVLEKWVENGQAPAADSLIGTDAAPATLGRTRPLCDYPKFPRYKGTGDVNAASSYQCSASLTDAARLLPDGNVSLPAIVESATDEADKEEARGPSLLGQEKLVVRNCRQGAGPCGHGVQ